MASPVTVAAIFGGAMLVLQMLLSITYNKGVTGVMVACVAAAAFGGYVLIKEASHI